MDLSQRLARILGPLFIALAVTEWTNLPLLMGNSPGVVYLNGTLLFAAGVAVVQAHNRWAFRWPLAITLSGWALMVGGAYRMMAPEAPQAARGIVAGAMLIVMLIVGTMMSWQGYRR